MINELSTIIGNIVSQMDSTIYGGYIDQKTYTCDSKWARVGKKVTNSDGDEFLLTEVEFNTFLIGENKRFNSVRWREIYLRNRFLFTELKRQPTENGLS